MIKNYFKTAIRNLIRNRVYAGLNISGLALGLACALVIYKVIDYELSFDRFHTKYDEIYRIVKHTELADHVDKESGAPQPMAKTLRSEYPAMQQVGMIQFMEDMNVSVEINGTQERFLEDGITFAEPQIFDILDFIHLAGSDNNLLANPNEVILARSMAEKLFKVEPPQFDQVLGKTVTLEGNLDLLVIGVFEDYPEETDFPFTMMVSYESQAKINPLYQNGHDWGTTMSSTNCLLILPEGWTTAQMEANFANVVEKYHEEKQKGNTSYFLQPLGDIHFNDTYENYNDRFASPRLLQVLIVVGIFLILAACINFINLTTAQAVNRSKEIGIRKVLGGFRTQLMSQFLGETFLVTVLSVIISLGLAELLLINLVDVLGFRLRLDLLNDPRLLLFMGLLIVMVTLLSGFYPSLLLARLKPVVALKGKLASQFVSGGLNLRRTLVVVQFTISQFLVIGTLVVINQMTYFKEKPLGFARDGVVMVELPQRDAQSLERFKNSLSDIPAVDKISFNFSSPLGTNNAESGFMIPGREDRYQANFKVIDENYLELFEIPILAGRNIRPTDSLNAILVNEQILAIMGKTPEEAIGEKVVTGFGGRAITIVGVVSDFHQNSLHTEIVPTALIQYPDFYYEAAIKFNRSAASQAGLEKLIDDIESAFVQAFPNSLINFEFLDKRINDMYESEQRLSMLFQLFAVIAIFISCLGIYGLVSFIGNQKVKEIGVRKVLGASVWNILSIFSKELLLLIGVAFVVAGPLGFFTMNNWLSNFTYRIAIGPGVFLLALLLSFAIAIATTGFRSYRAAVSDPAKSLRDE